MRVVVFVTALLAVGALVVLTGLVLVARRIPDADFGALDEGVAEEPSG